jgi:hypothetical protein
MASAELPLGGLAATGVVLTAALMHWRRQKAVDRPPAVGAIGRGAVSGSILIMPVDAMRVRLQARGR